MNTLSRFFFAVLCTSMGANSMECGKSDEKNKADLFKAAQTILAFKVASQPLFSSFTQKKRGELGLKEYGIYDLPSFIIQLGTACSLKAEFIQPTQDQLTAFPVEALDLAGNELTGLTPELEVFAPALKRLDISRNPIKNGVPAVIGSLTNLEALNLAFEMPLKNCKHQLEEVIGSLNGLTRLTVLSETEISKDQLPFKVAKENTDDTDWNGYLKTPYRFKTYCAESK